MSRLRGRPNPRSERAEMSAWAWEGCAGVRRFGWEERTGKGAVLGGGGGQGATGPAWEGLPKPVQLHSVPTSEGWKFLLMCSSKPLPPRGRSASSRLCKCRLAVEAAWLWDTKLTVGHKAGCEAQIPPKAQKRRLKVTAKKSPGPAVRSEQNPGLLSGEGISLPLGTEGPAKRLQNAAPVSRQGQAARGEPRALVAL